MNKRTGRNKCVLMGKILKLINKCTSTIILDSRVLKKKQYYRVTTLKYTARNNPRDIPEILEPRRMPRNDRA